MPATTFPAPPRRTRTRRTRRPHPERIALASEVLATLATMATTPAVGDLVAALDWPLERLAPILDSLDRADLVERWPDPFHRGTERVMLSARSLARLGLALGPRGDRWHRARSVG